MYRYLLAGVSVLLLLVIGSAIFASIDPPDDREYMSARNRGAEYLGLHLYTAALKEFGEAEKLRPGEADPRIGMASTYIRLGEAAKAVQEAARATEIEKESSDAWTILGRAHWQEQNFGDAETAALKARDLNARNSAAGELLLRVYFDQNQAEKFQAELDRTTQHSSDVQELAARFYLKRGEFARAHDLRTRHRRWDLDVSILETELAIKREPQRSDLRDRMIRDLVNAGRYAEAVEQVQGLTSNLSGLDFELAKAYWMTGRKEDAIRSYRQASAGLVYKLPAEIALAAITGDVAHWREAFRAERPVQDYFILSQLETLLTSAGPLTRAYVYRYAGLFDSQFYNKSAEAALMALNDEPLNFDALMTIANAYQHIGRIADATHYMELARDAFPRSAEPVSRLANLTVASAAKEPQRIVDLMAQAVTLEPDNAGYLYNLGWVYDQIGDKAKATDLYQRAIRASPLSFEAMNNLALIYGQSGQPERALQLLQMATETDPENEVAYFNLASYHVRRHDWRAALQNYDRVLQLNPMNVAASTEKGRIYLEMGRSQSAVGSLNNAIALDAHSYDAYMLLSSAYTKMGKTRESEAATEEAQRIQARPQK